MNDELLYYIGQMVHYVLDSGAHRPAVIVADWGDGCVNLQVFTDNMNDMSSLFGAPKQSAENTAWRTSVIHSSDHKAGTWHHIEGLTKGGHA